MALFRSRQQRVTPPAEPVAVPGKGEFLTISGVQIECILDRSELPSSVWQLAPVVLRALGRAESEANVAAVTERMTAMFFMSIETVFAEIFKAPQEAERARAVLLRDDGLEAVRSMAVEHPSGADYLDLQFLKTVSMLSSRSHSPFRDL